jgi:hypothetical protein
MSTLAFQDAELPVMTDDMNALEQRVLRTVELLRTERAARATAEQNAATLQLLLDEQSLELLQAQEQLKALEGEREGVKHRVEKLLKQLDEIG